jgi:glycosyltransferase involved in cell wall biosynthesis
LDGGGGQSGPASGKKEVLMKVTAIVLTRDEALNLPACLGSLTWCDRVVVFDSFSRDSTPDIARSLGAEVVQHVFVDYASQRQAALDCIGSDAEWVLMIDADEQVDEELKSEIQAIARDGSRKAAFRMRRKDQFMGRWIKHSSLYPSWFVRLFRAETVQFPVRMVHEYPTIVGEIGALQGHLIHNSFGKGLREWWRKHLRYARLEAEENAKALANPMDWWIWASWVDPVARRSVLKRFSMELPWRRAFRFVYMYIIRGGILDGAAGYKYCCMIARYESLIERELKRIQRLKLPVK